MNVSTKGRYALRLMLDIAENGQNKNVSLKDISSRQSVSAKYLEQIIAALCKADLVKSSRGSNGGYRLAKEASECTVGEILRATEGSLAPSLCAENGENCDRFCQCKTAIVWKKINDAINEVVDNTTLADLM